MFPLIKLPVPSIVVVPTQPTSKAELIITQFLKLKLNLTITLLSAGGCYLPFVMLVRTYQVLLLSTSPVQSQWCERAGRAGLAEQSRAEQAKMLVETLRSGLLCGSSVSQLSQLQT